METGSNCPDFCSVTKCEELENRISALEQALELLQASFEAHTNQDIPIAHNYNSNIKIDGSYQSNTLTVTVADQTSQDTATIQIPDSNVTVSLAADSANNTLKVFVAVGSENDDATITLPEPEVQVSLAASTNGDLKVFVAVGNKNDSETITLPIQPVDFEPIFPFLLARLLLEIRPEINLAIEQKYSPSNLKIGGIFQSDVLTLTVADGESQDTATIFIPLPEMNCEFFEEKLNDCCDEIINLIASNFNNLDNQLANLENAINTEIKEVYDEVTVDISGTADSYYTCGFEFKNGKFVPGHAEPGSSERTYTGKGLKGIDASLKIVNSNLRRMFDSVCASVQPPQTLYLEDLYQFCDDSNIKRTDYPDGNDGTENYKNAVKAYLQSLLNETKYADLINSANGNVLFNAPQYWATNVLADFSLIQGKINNKKLCDLKFEEPDVISIVASPKYVTNVDGKVLILHFVSEGNYPKRARGSSYRQIQIPGAKTEYNWELHFENLRWSQGNQYAELVLNEYRATVSGWFESESAANTFFDDVLSLTIGTEKNRKFPKHKFPRADIQSQITRPYRAFIESINLQGQAVCHVKYVPPIEPE